MTHRSISVHRNLTSEIGCADATRHWRKTLGTVPTKVNDNG